MKNKKNIAMRCNQEQWELLKPKLENVGYKDFEIDGFETYKYLTNNLRGWAEIIPTKTIQEAEELLKELGHEIKIV